MEELEQKLKAAWEGQESLQNAASAMKQATEAYGSAQVAATAAWDDLYNLLHVLADKDDTFRHSLLGCAVIHFTRRESSS